MSDSDAVVAFTWDRPATGGHHDLSLRLGSWIHPGDSYYFAIEAESFAGGAAAVVTAAAIVEVMQALLRQWKHRVLQLADAGLVYLPYRFADQSTAWLRVQRSGDQLEVQAGWSSLMGYPLSPSDFSAVQPTDWKRIDAAPAVVTTMEEWVRAVALSSAALARRAGARPPPHASQAN